MGESPGTAGGLHLEYYQGLQPHQGVRAQPRLKVTPVKFWHMEHFDGDQLKRVFHDEAEAGFGELRAGHLHVLQFSKQSGLAGPHWVYHCVWTFLLDYQRPGTEDGGQVRQSPEVRAQNSDVGEVEAAALDLEAF